MSSQTIFNYSDLSISETFDEILTSNSYSNTKILISVIVGTSCISFGNHCFINCTSLTSIDVKDTVVSFGDNCFENCISLISLIIPPSVVNFGSQCFINCRNLISLSIPEGTTSLGFQVFNSCLSLSSITLPLTLTSLSDGCFFNCVSLLSIIIPTSIIFFGNSCFESCMNLLSITIPPNVISIGNSCFYNCVVIKSIVISENITLLDNNCFYNCKSLESITITSKITSIGSSCFQNCENLNLIIYENPLNIITLGEEIFTNTPALTVQFYATESTPSAPTNPTGVYDTSLYRGGSVYEYFNYESVFIYSDSTSSVSYDEILTSASYDNSRFLINAIVGTLCKKLDSNCFENQVNLSILRIPNTVTFFGDMCFTNCAILRGIVIPNTVTSIGYACFQDCSSLLTCKISENIEIMPMNCFFNCSNLYEITIPKNITSIGNNSFKNCYELKLIVYLNPLNIVNLGANLFLNTLALTVEFYSTLSAPNAPTTPSGVYNTDLYRIGSIFKYFNNLNVFNYTDGTSSTTTDDRISLSSYDRKKILRDFVISSFSKSFENYCFFNCTSLQRAIIPNNIISLGDYCFSNCTLLNTLGIPFEAPSFGNYFLERCFNITVLNIPSNITSLGIGCFESCINLFEITLHNNINYIGAYCFSNCIGLSTITIPPISSINDYCFFNCSRFTTINIPEGCLSVGNGCFENCTGVKSIVMPLSVSSIGNSCFENCLKLLSIIIPTNVNFLGNKCFKNCLSLTSVIYENPVIINITEKNIFTNCPPLNVKFYLTSSAPLPPLEEIGVYDTTLYNIGSIFEYFVNSTTINGILKFAVSDIYWDGILPILFDNKTMKINVIDNQTLNNIQIQFEFRDNGITECGFTLNVIPAGNINIIPTRDDKTQQQILKIHDFSKIPLSRRINQFKYFPTSISTSEFNEYTKLFPDDPNNVPTLLTETNVIGLFENIPNFNGDISSWNINTVYNKTLTNMFSNAYSFNQDLSKWNISNITDMSNMLNNTNLSIENYDKLLNAWSLQKVQPNVLLNAVGLQYSEIGEVGRNILTNNTNKWIITGDVLTYSITTTYNKIYEINIELKRFIKIFEINYTLSKKEYLKLISILKQINEVENNICRLIKNNKNILGINLSTNDILTKYILQYYLKIIIMQINVIKIILYTSKNEKIKNCDFDKIQKSLKM
jgi:surface protein